MAKKDFSLDERKAVYKAIFSRRDIRMYRPTPIPSESLHRILQAGHSAGSVGMMQPWNFILLDDVEKRSRVHRHFAACNTRASEVWSDEKQVHYGALKLQGILDSPLNIIITCDHTRGGTHVLGRHTIPETDTYSTCLAVQNMWLAARSEGIGMGWLSIMEPDVVKTILEIPEHVSIIAYMTVGFPVEFPKTPLLEAVGWKKREALQNVVFNNGWNVPYLENTGANEESAPTKTSISSFDSQTAENRQENLTKPKGSLGKLESVALQICRLQRSERPVLNDAAVYILAGDHGVTEERISAYIPEMTAKMVIQFVSGGAAINAIARENNQSLNVVDMGVDHDFSSATGVIAAKVRRGTRNFSREPAMTREECQLAIQRGRELLFGNTASIIGIGEMGIGNSSSACAIACAMLGLSVSSAVGMGTGIGQETLLRKTSVIQTALDLHREQCTGPFQILQRMGGFEIAGLVGLLLEAAENSIPVVLDGFITGAAALVAVRMNPKVRDVLIAGTRSSEPSHQPILDELDLHPLLNLGIRLGEGAGAAMAIPLVQSACRCLAEMTTFEEAGIPEPMDTVGRT